MKRRSFFRSLAAAVISIPLARMIGAEKVEFASREFPERVPSGYVFVEDPNPARFQLVEDSSGVLHLCFMK